jgi:ketosteroid isomerase-like protein
VTREEEIVQRVREGFAALSREDFDEVVSLLHPDIEYIPVGGQPPLRGRDAMREWMEPSAFSQQVLEPREISVHGNKVLVRLHSRARGAASGIDVEVESWSVLTLDEELRITRSVTYFLRDEDLARADAES